MKKKTKQTMDSNQTTNLVTTPTNPEWVTSGVQGLAGKIGTVFDKFNPADLAPGPTALQQQAAQGAGGLTTSPNYGIASGMLQDVGAAGPQKFDFSGITSADIQSLLNPDLEGRVKSSLDDFDFGAGQQMGQANLDLGQDTTFGGSSGALYKRGLADDITRGRGALSAGLRSDAYDKAAGLASTNAGMKLQAGLANANLAEQALARRAGAATGLAGIAGQQGEDSRANVQSQATMGELLRQILAAQGAAPITALGQQAGLMGQLPYDLFRGSNSNGTMTGKQTTKTTESGGMGDLIKLAASIALAAPTGGASLAMGAGALKNISQ